MFQRGASIPLKCHLHDKPVKFICVENHTCNPEKNRTLCEECMLTHQKNSSLAYLESVSRFLSGDFIYSDMQKTIDSLQNKLSETHFENVEKLIRETFDKLQVYFAKVIEESKLNILANLKGKRLERNFILTSWKRLQENLENKLEVLTEQTVIKNKDLEEYIELFHEFKNKAKSEQSFSKFEEEFEHKLSLEDETLKELKKSLTSTLEGFKKDIWSSAPNLVQSTEIDCDNVNFYDTVHFGRSGFRLFGMKYIKDFDKLVLCDRTNRFYTYDFLTRQVKDIGVNAYCSSFEYIPKQKKLLLGLKGCVYARDLYATMSEQDVSKVKIVNSEALVTSIQYAYENDLVFCSGLFPNIYCLSPDNGFKVVSTIMTNEQSCPVMYYIQGRGILAAGFEHGYINLYNTRDNTLKDTLKGHTRRILSFDYNYTRDIMVTGSKDGSMRVWMVRNNEFKINRIFESQKNSPGVSTVQFLNNNIIMSLHKDLYIRFWEALSGKSLGRKQVFQTEGHVALYLEERRTLFAGEFENGNMHILKFS